MCILHKQIYSSGIKSSWGGDSEKTTKETPCGGDNEKSLINTAFGQSFSFYAGSFLKKYDMSGSFKLNCRTKQLYSGGGTAFESSQKLRIDTQKTGLVSAPWLRLLSKPKGTPPRSPSVTSSRFLSARGLVGVFPLPKGLDAILLCPVHKSEDFSTIECG